MGPATAGVSGNKGWALSSFVLGKLPLSRKLLSCRFPFNLQRLSRVWVRGEVDLADPSHEICCYQGQQWRTAAGFRRDFCATRVSYLLSPLLPNQARIWLFQFSIGGQSEYTKSLLLTQACYTEGASASLSSSRLGPFLTGRSDVKAAACCGTDAYLIIADGHRGMQKVPDLSEVLKPFRL